MAKKKFVLQGFTPATHVDAVKDLLGLSSIQNALISVAFANARGVELLRKAVSPIGQDATVFVGIRNDVTTKQGLAALLDLKVKLYAIDTGGRSPLFHPKLFLARSKSAAKIVIGSANLTPGGLNNNIEASLALELDLSNKDDVALLTSIEDEFKQLPTDYPDHVFRVRNLKEVVKLADDGRLIDEAISNPPNPVASAKGNKADKVPRIKLKTKPVHVVLPSPTKIKAVTTKATAQASTATSVAPAWMLVWEMLDLKRRDLTIPVGTNTNATGSINLDKGELPDAIDFRHYFRTVVFNGLKWKPASNTTETGEATFRLVIKNVDQGEFSTEVRHSTSTTSKSYLQKNAMTRLSWGPMSAFVRRVDLIGRSLKLYSDANDKRRFLIEID